MIKAILVGIVILGGGLLLAVSYSKADDNNDRDTKRLILAVILAIVLLGIFFGSDSD
ncbi:MAG: hypothetical protein IM598_12065 [Chitinophagaceae bacterium]|nr:hypothetical protein [Chitinophagaceae bacterium]MCA6459027.1 hypothetical protein [Chitinophagaceae bacterium]MCA6465557.1 hypothetical protein [Chitinophagaceae bacterium]